MSATTTVNRTAEKLYRRNSRKQRTSGAGWVQHVVLAVSILLAWEIAGRTIFANSLFIGPFSEVVAALYEWFRTGFIWPHLRTSMAELIIGFAISAVVGVMIGVILGSSNRLYTLLNPWVGILYVTPMVAITPVFILAFGIGIASKVALIISLAVFPIIVNTSAGFRSVDKRYLELAASFNASRRDLAFKIRLPASLPFILSGLRLGSGRAVIGVVVGEFFLAREGVGYLIAQASATFATADLFAGVIIFGLIGLSFFYTFEVLERRVAPWREIGSKD